MNIVSWENLNRGDDAALQSLISGLSQWGFVRVRLPADTILETLKEGVAVGRNMAGFRFPPVDGVTTYTAAHRACFEALYDLSRQCLSWLIRQSEPAPATLLELRRCLAQSYEAPAELFGEAGEGNIPFPNDQTPFANSFFNIFHYDHGLLNAHKDRYLITAIYAEASPSTAHTRSALWVRARNGQWTNVDALLESDIMVFMIGEDLEAVLKPMGSELYAAEHCIRVDPDGERLARAHFRPDPDTPLSGNRLSVAYILGAESVSTHLDF